MLAVIICPACRIVKDGGGSDNDGSGEDGIDGCRQGDGEVY